MQRKGSSLFLPTEKTKASAEYLLQSQYDATTADCCDVTSNPQGHAYAGRLKAGCRMFS